MADRTQPAGRNDGRSGGPSDALRAWVDFAKELCDWLIEARRRWHEGDPPPAGRRVRLLASWAVAAAAIAAVLERALGG